MLTSEGRDVDDHEDLVAVRRHVYLCLLIYRSEGILVDVPSIVHAVRCLGPDPGGPQAQEQCPYTRLHGCRM